MENNINGKKIIRKVIALFLAAIILSLILLFRLLDFEIINQYFLIAVIAVSFLVSGYAVLFKYIKHSDKQKYIYYQTADFLFILNTALIFLQIFFIFVLFPATVEQDSMRPTLNDGDEVIVISLGKVERGKVVIVKVDEKYNEINGTVKDGDLLVKRVIAGPGDAFFFQNNTLFLNGMIVEEDYLPAGAITRDFRLDEILECPPGNECRIPEDFYFVMGDNRQNSYDSRNFGLVHKSQIVGVVKYRRMGFLDWGKVK